jgi:hypothetical protein
MKMGGLVFTAGDVQKDYADTAPRTVKRMLWGERYRGLEQGWPRKQLVLRLVRMARVMQRQIVDKDRLQRDDIKRLLDF